MAIASAAKPGAAGRHHLAHGDRKRGEAGRSGSPSSGRVTIRNSHAETLALVGSTARTRSYTPRMRALRLFCAVAAAAVLAVSWSPRVGLAAAALPTPAHVVIVVEENRSQAGIIGNKSAPFINALAAGGAMMAQSFAETHPSQPNYLALFAGDTFGLTKNTCPVNGGALPNLGSELLSAGYTFGGFAEDLPTAGSAVCSAGKYARKH